MFLNLNTISNNQLSHLRFILIFECNVKGVRGSDRNNNTLNTEKYQAHIFGSFAYKVVCVDDRFSKPGVSYRRRNEVYTFIETTLGEYDYCKK